MKVIFVSTNGNDTTGDGSYAHPYATIEKSLTVFDSGDQIRILDGEYITTDNIVIEGKEGSIFAENPGGVTIRPRRVSSRYACISIGRSNRFTIQGIKVKQAQDRTGNSMGIALDQVNNFLIQTCVVDDFQMPSAGCGIIAIGNHGRIENCIVEDIVSTHQILYGICTDGLIDVLDCTIQRVSGTPNCRLSVLSVGDISGLPIGDTMDWSIPVNHDIIPDTDGAYDVGKVDKKFRDGYFSGKLTVDGGIDPIYLSLTPVNPSLVTIPIGSFFIDSSDGNKLKFKQYSGVILDLADYSTPAEYHGDTTTVFPAGVPNGSTAPLTIATPATGNAAREGFIANVALVDSSGLGNGDVLIEIFNDVGRSELVFSRTFNLSESPLTDTIPAHFKSDNSAGDGAMYISITNYTGTTGSFEVDVRTALIRADNSYAGGSGGVDANSTGNGLEFDGSRVNVDLESNSGLELNGTAPNKKLRVKAGSGIQRTAGGAAVDSTVLRTTGNQNIAGSKRFTSSVLGITPMAGHSGPPVAPVAYLAGDLFVDQDYLVWQCVVAGSPGSWTLFGAGFLEDIDTGIGAGVVTSTYTAEVAAGASVDVTLDVDGNFGFIQKLNIWGTDPAGGDDWPAANLDQPFRIICFPNDNYFGREQIWSIQGQLRKTYLDGVGAAAGTDVLTVNTVDHGAPDDLVRLRRKAAVIGEEYGRVTVRSTGGPSYTLDETLLNTLDANDPVMLVTEFIHLPYYNDSTGTPKKLFLRIFNDGATAVKYGYQANVTYLGGSAY